MHRLCTLGGLSLPIKSHGIAFNIADEDEMCGNYSSIQTAFLIYQLGYIFDIARHRYNYMLIYFADVGTQDTTLRRFELFPKHY